MAIAVHRRRVYGPRTSPQLQIDNDLYTTRAYIQIYRKFIYSRFDTKFKIRNSFSLQNFFGNQAYIRTFTNSK